MSSKPNKYKIGLPEENPQLDYQNAYPVISPPAKLVMSNLQPYVDVNQAVGQQQVVIQLTSPHMFWDQQKSPLMVVCNFCGNKDFTLVERKVSCLQWIGCMML